MMKNLFYGAVSLALLMTGASFSALELEKLEHYKKIVEAEDEMLKENAPFYVLHGK